MNDRNKRERKPYTKPEVRRVELKPEESLAAGCKTMGGGGPVAPDCETGGCFNFGS